MFYELFIYYIFIYLYAPVLWLSDFRTNVKTHHPKVCHALILTWGHSDAPNHSPGAERLYTPLRRTIAVGLDMTLGCSQPGSHHFLSPSFWLLTVTSIICRFVHCSFRAIRRHTWQGLKKKKKQQHKYVVWRLGAALIISVPTWMLTLVPNWRRDSGMSGCCLEATLANPDGCWG